MNEDNIYSRKMTPVRVIDDDDGVKVVFLESARFYQLAKSDPDFDSLVGIVREAVEQNRPVEISQLCDGGFSKEPDSYGLSMAHRRKDTLRGDVA